MSRKIARTFFISKKTILFMTLPLLAIMAFSCGDDNDSEPDNPQDGTPADIIGRWQKYRYVEDDGSMSPADYDEFWIYGRDNSFMVEDGGEITDRGTYKVEGSMLIISQYNVDYPTERQEFRGYYEIKNGYMNYQFTEVGEDDGYTEYIFRKM